MQKQQSIFRHFNDIVINISFEMCLHSETGFDACFDSFV